MIAPIRRSAERSSSGLAGARRSVATVLFSQPVARRAMPRASRVATAFFLGWLLAVAASYLLAGSWWTLRRP